jgi:hypothetical protein
MFKSMEDASVSRWTGPSPRRLLPRGSFYSSLGDRMLTLSVARFRSLNTSEVPRYYKVTRPLDVRAWGML